MTDIENLKDTEQFMRAIGQGIDNALKLHSSNLGFALIVFEFNKPSMSNYISTGKREDMIDALEETVKRLRGNEDMPAAVGGVQ